MRSQRPQLLFVAIVFGFLITAIPLFAADTVKVLHFFGKGTDGSEPESSLIFDASGNLYGATGRGGAYGYGTVFKLTPNNDGTWSETLLHSFNKNGKDGYEPDASLILDAAGNLYGVTALGGSDDLGTVFELTPKAGGGWTEKILHSFRANVGDGNLPAAGLVFDAAGNLYGTTVEGGTAQNGTVFELTPKAGGGWTEKILHRFNLNGEDGADPYAGLIFDAAGNLYGTASAGGADGGGGTVFELSAKAGGGWTEKVLHSFNLYDGGSGPMAGLVFDSAGSLYGTTLGGGAFKFGTAFQLTPEAGGRWAHKVLRSFGGNQQDGKYPSGLIFDAAGDLYGTTQQGSPQGAGIAFELKPEARGPWDEEVLLTFGLIRDDDGGNPSGLIFDAAGNLYGTTAGGGADGGGVAFELTP
jgi:uncharacterized repeat protein (TIGR03803 family)